MKKMEVLIYLWTGVYFNVRNVDVVEITSFTARGQDDGYPEIDLFV